MSVTTARQARRQDPMVALQMDRIDRILRAATLYHDDGLTQKAVAKELNLHRTEVSRMLTEARQKGIVRVEVDARFGQTLELSQRLCEVFDLDDALVVPGTNAGDLGADLARMGGFADPFLHHKLEDKNVLGVSWGLTLAHVAKSFRLGRNPKGVTVVPLIGGPRGVLPPPYQANGIAFQLASRIEGGLARSIDAPAVVSESLSEELVNNPNFELVRQHWHEMDVAVFGIGATSSTSSESWHQFYKGSPMMAGLQGEAVGDILGRPFSADGEFLPVPGVGIIGIEPDVLRRTSVRVGIACGAEKVPAILGALRTGMVSVLITTTDTAAGLLDAHTSG